MQSHYPARFERDMACTEAEWLGWLPQAIGEHAWQSAPGAAHVRIGSGTLQLSWQVAPPRRIGLIELPRMQVTFAFDDVGDEVRHAFMKRFDLYTQRGGG